MNQLEATKCLGCGDLFHGSGLCPDCVRLDDLYESKRRARILMLDRAREDVGVVAYAPPPEPPFALPLAILLAIVVGALLGAVPAWHYGKLAILFLCGAN